MPTRRALSRLRWIATIGIAGLALAAPLAAQQMGLPSAPPGPNTPPPPITPPEEAMKDAIASDPVFWWRQESFRTQAMEPPPSFYWPDARVAGAARAFLPAAAPGKTSISPAMLDKAAAWAEANNSRALIIIHRGKVQFERYWKGLSPTEITNGRAITRGFVPMLLGFAVADHTVDLDAPIGRYLSQWRDDPRGQITLRQLGQNVSGLEHDGPTGTVYGNRQVRIFYSGDVVSAALAMLRIEAPGQHFEVSEVNTQLLSLVLERAVGKPINQQLSERVWRPIGASDATFQLDRPGGTVRTLCCMRATPRDLARVGQLLVQDGKWEGRQVLPAGWVATMAAPSPNNPNYGLGFWLGTPFARMRSYTQGVPGTIPQSEPFLADDVRFFEGGGFRELYVVPSKQLVILRLGYASPTWDNAFLVNTAIRGMGN